MRTLVGFLGAVVAACTSLPGEPTGPLELDAVSPAIGSVAGGTRITLQGKNLSASDVVMIGNVPCTNVSRDSASSISCMTGGTHFREGTVDVAVSRGADRVVLASAFTYECLWSTTRGRRSCGAAPPGG